MFNGHIDTVPPFGMDAPYAAEVREGKLWGRGAADMKAGVGAMAYALVVLRRLGIKLKGDLVFAGVIDEDAAGSAGSRYIVANGPKTDYAVVGEPTKLMPVIAHKGIDYFKVIVDGKAAHSSMPETGVNAIHTAARFITAIEDELIPLYKKQEHPLVGAPTVNVGLVQGCARANKQYLLGSSATFAGIVPDLCEVYIDIRWTPYQSVEKVLDDLEDISAKIRKSANASIKIEYIPLPRPAMEAGMDSPIVRSLHANATQVNGYDSPPQGVMFWADSGLLYGMAGIPTVVLGPGDIGCAHSENEHVDVQQITQAAKIYLLTALDICGYEI